MKLLTTKTESEKVTNTVGTFLNEDSTRSLFERAIGNNYQQVVLQCLKVKITKRTSEKVTNMVGTFLKEDSIGSTRTHVQKSDWLYLPEGRFIFYASASYSRGIRKGDQYGGNLFE